MKLAKLSLAAMVAVGAMSSFASATPLEEAIKDVDLEGFARYRFTDNNKGLGDNHEFKLLMQLVVPVADNLKVGGAGKLLVNDRGEGQTGTALRSGSVDADGELLHGWAEYARDGFSLKAGRMAIPTPWTDGSLDGSIGDGALAMYTGLEGWAFAAAAYVNNNAGTGYFDGNATDNNETVYTGNLDNFIDEKNIYALAAIGSIEPVSLQLWAAHMEDVFKHSIFAEVGFEMAGFTARLQANHMKLEDNVSNILGFPEDSGIYFGGEVGYGISGFNVRAGYMQADKDMPIYNLASSDSQGFIFAGKQIDGEMFLKRDAKTAFIDLGYKLDKFDVGAGFVNMDWLEQNPGEDNTATEWYVQAGYDYSKNFRLSTFYSDLNADENAVGTSDNKRVRFEALYSF